MACNFLLIKLCIRCTEIAAVRLIEYIQQGLNGIRTHDLCGTGAVLYQLSYQATWELVTLWVRNIPVESEASHDQSWFHIFLGSSNISSFLYLFASFTFYGYITNSQSESLLEGLITQLVEHYTGRKMPRIILWERVLYCPYKGYYHRRSLLSSCREENGEARAPFLNSGWWSSLKQYWK